MREINSLSFVTMTDQLSLSLRPWSTPNTHQENLPFLISRIKQQRGSFRQVTEQSLQEEVEVKEPEDAEDVKSDDSVPKDGIDDGKSRKEKLLAARDETFKQIA